MRSIADGPFEVLDARRIEPLPSEAFTDPRARAALISLARDCALAGRTGCFLTLASVSPRATLVAGALVLADSERPLELRLEIGRQP